MSRPDETEVLIAGGGPVGLACALELAHRDVDVVVVEPRRTVSHARPRCKTVNVRTMEHLRRWGLADRLRAAVPVPVAYSQDVAFCTSLTGRELSRFHGVLGLLPEGDRFPEVGQQAPQYVLEELLRAALEEVAPGALALGERVTGVAQDEAHVRAEIVDEHGHARTVSASYLVGADGPRSAVREAIGSRYVGDVALRPNFGMVVRAPGLLAAVPHAPAVQFWILNAAAPALMGPLDLDETWWMIAFDVDEPTGIRDAVALVQAAAGYATEVDVVSTDPWRARMQLVDRARHGRVFLAGDAAHLNPPFGGHGLNTGIGDAVDLGWKLSAALAGWGGAHLLDSYEAERRPIQERVIAAASANNRVLAGDLLGDDLDADGPAGEAARRHADAAIQASKAAEFHALDLVLDLGLDGSPVLAEPAAAPGVGGGDRHAIVGERLPHGWLASGASVYDALGDGFTVLVVGRGATDDADALLAAGARRGVPLSVVRVEEPWAPTRYGASLVLVRPDQHVAWAGDAAPADVDGLVDRVRGA